MSRRRSIHAGSALLLATGAATVLPVYAVADVLAAKARRDDDPEPVRSWRGVARRWDRTP